MQNHVIDSIVNLEYIEQNYISGKILGMASAVKGGIGTASIKLANGIIIGAIVAVNAFGDILDHKSGKIIEGARNPETGDIIDTASTILSAPQMGVDSTEVNFSGNTTIGVVATNAKLTKEQANKLASISHDGLALAIRPVHTMADGDTMFALSAGELEGDFMAIGCAAVEVTARAIVNAITNAGGME